MDTSPSREVKAPSSSHETAQNRKINHPPPALPETSHINKVKAPPHVKTRSYAHLFFSKLVHRGLGRVLLAVVLAAFFLQCDALVVVGYYRDIGVVFFLTRNPEAVVPQSLHSARYCFGFSGLNYFDKYLLRGLHLLFRRIATPLYYSLKTFLVDGRLGARGQGLVLVVVVAPGHDY